MKRLKDLMMLAALASIAACDRSMPADLPVTDQCLRAKLFQECLSAVPKGPDVTTYNDWAEVLAECENHAYYASRRTDRTAVTKECLAP